MKKALFVVASTCVFSIVTWIRQNTNLSGFAFASVIALLVISELLLLWVFHAYVYQKYFHPLRGIPSAKNWTPLLGHAFQDLGKDQVHGSSIRTWVRDMPEADIIRFSDFTQGIRLLVVSPRALSDVLTTRCYDFQKPGFFRKGSSVMILGDGVLFAEGPVHRRQRKQLNPAFTYRHVKDLYPTFWKCAVELVSFVEASADGDSCTAVVEPNDITSRVTLDILGEAGFGKSFGAVLDPENKTTKAYRGLFGRSSKWDIACEIAEQLLPSDFVLRMPFERNRRLKANTAILRDVCRGLIRDKRETVERQGSLPTLDILSVILSQKEVTFNEDEMIEQLLTFLGAGHETTASGLAWALYTFCKQPEFQTRIRDELREKLPASAWDKTDPTLTAADLDSCAYLHAFCAEILRYYPPVPATVREAATDTIVAGRPIPKGTILLIAPWAVNVNRALWGPDAEEFRPGRWLESPSGGGCRSNYGNLTFIHGPRNCIGSAFAKAEFQCVVAAWAARFETSFHRHGEDWKEPGVDMLSGITARPTHGWKAAAKLVRE